MKETTVVARLSDIKPGQMHYVDVDGLPIALANVDGTIYAFGDSCRHEGGPLSSGVLRDDIVTCPWHGWAYNVRTGKSLIPPVGLRVPTYPVEIDGDRIAVVIDWPDD
ncbi:MAG TPA: non-heme iron oxygenase ferredoxin subunit [Herpetosiphonaceae bacterium]|jgi:nitrite reductase/ring-hydroxylating ferredoxin subunit|nr:non-heme iron oxygenase ferredoxin subunit [Herpetosiphonaceae bacterium]